MFVTRVLPKRVHTQLRVTVALSYLTHHFSCTKPRSLLQPSVAGLRELVKSPHLRHFAWAEVYLTLISEHLHDVKRL